MTSAWTHPMCNECWNDPDLADVLGIEPGRAPVRLAEPDLETCCFCTVPTTSGIYVRANPAILLCHGHHQEVPG